MDTCWHSGPWPWSGSAGDGGSRVGDTDILTMCISTSTSSIATVTMPSTSGRALSAYIPPRSWIASTTRPVPIAIIRMSEATRTKRYPGGGTPIWTTSAGGRS